VNLLEETLLRVDELKKWFPVRTGFVKSLVGGEKFFVKAVDGISFDIKPREIYGLAGESGSGKTTTGRVVLKLIEPTGGKIYYRGKDITKLKPKEFTPYRRKMQIIFQDPYESLNPRMTVGSIVSEPLHIQKICKNEREVQERVATALNQVQLTPPEEFVSRFPHEVSGGQRQRIAVARALVLKPEFIVADEPVSMLDVSIRAEVLNLMVDLMEKLNVAFLYVTHDLALARHICNRLAIMYLGKIMERGYTEDIIYEPLHPYTRALMAAVPVPDPESKRAEVVIKGEIPSPINPPSGCRFHTRCPQYIGDICRLTEPRLVHVGKDRDVACHLYSEKT
jgi:peptide/nickel transport system ATP-binding protein